jgi:vacuolar-type H+-ATPase subunit D/Vma8
MKPAEKIERLIKKSRYKASSEAYDKALGSFLQVVDAYEKQKPALTEPNIWRIIMKSKITKIAAVAVIVLAVVFSMTIFDKSMPTAYAIEQTIQASHSVQYLHIRAITLSHEDQPVEFWIEFAQDGQPKNMRLNLPDWMAPGDGPREVIWKGNKKQEWLKEKNILTTTEDEASPAEILKMIENLDSKLAVTRLQEKQEQGKVELEINESADKAEPIIVTATSTKEDDSSFQRMVLYIDQATKLVNAIELYKLRNGEYEYMKKLEYYDYNQPIDAKMFMFKDVSNDAEHIDLMTIGLAQGNLSDEEIAVEVVRQYLEALIARNYDKASKLFPAVPADKIKEMFGEINIIRIVSMGKPILHSETNHLRVPFEVEVEMEGKINLWKKQGPLVHHLAGQPGRWAIFGEF